MKSIRFGGWVNKAGTLLNEDGEMNTIALCLGMSLCGQALWESETSIKTEEIIELARVMVHSDKMPDGVATIYQPKEVRPRLDQRCVWMVETKQPFTSGQCVSLCGEYMKCQTQGRLMADVDDQVEMESEFALVLLGMWPKQKGVLFLFVVDPHPKLTRFMAQFEKQLSDYLDQQYEEIRRKKIR